MKLPTIITPSLLHALRSYPQLPEHAWYIVSSVTLSALNFPDEIPHVFKDVIGSDSAATGSEPDRSEHVMNHSEQLRVARRMREALVKSSAVVGLPKVRADDPKGGLDIPFRSGVIYQPSGPQTTV
jgi:hypothetical protein